MKSIIRMSDIRCVDAASPVGTGRAEYGRSLQVIAHSPPSQACRRCPASIPTTARRSSATERKAASSSWRAGACRRRRLKGKKTDRGHERAQLSRRTGGAGSVLSTDAWCRSRASPRTMLPDGSKPPVWFALDETRPLAFFAGLWTTWTSVRKVKEGGSRLISSASSRRPQRRGRRDSPKAMPVILTEPAEWESWLTAPWADRRGRFNGR